MFDCCFRCEHAEVERFEQGAYKGCRERYLRETEPYKGSNYFCIPNEDPTWLFFKPTTKEIPFEILKARFLLTTVKTGVIK